ncbi:AlkA N-terminal domain-containing protein [Dactylosporangium matsuzakiense]|uniref:AlkA N-terminal domain-containing protein n=1 Tax=Dactylosporangium matsuzakiense TaxID=53360 RepID=UPI0021C38893|nr:AlkA N-terminal domain-containing protein [Dactylosporangium matsuzakiense]UWZ45794.1 DNA-3-methyladenine glycosylase 2 family protein [Dactylosporangium matsuzakiense]
MELDFETCRKAATSRDSRFDGVFVTAVKSTKIYCRPSCPAIVPKRENVRFLPTAAAAQREGFRACLRCRPDAAPGSPDWDVRGDVVGRAMRLIADGVVDRDGVPGLAGRLGYTDRHLHRMLSTEVGAGPLALARAQRAQTARVLIETTGLGLADIAFAAGFGSVRQFNDTIREIYGRTPSQLRERRTLAETDEGVVTVRLPYRAPLHAEALLSFLSDRAVDGIDQLDADGYHRNLRLPHGPGRVTLAIREGHVAATMRLTDLRDLAPAVARCRRLFDLDADPAAVDAVLGADPALAPMVLKEEGVRVPRATDGFEIAVRAVVGQQISVAAARTVLRRLIAADAGYFPSAEELLALPDGAFAMPEARRRTLRGLAEAVAAGDLDLDGGGDRNETIEKLKALPGIGDWTAQYTAMRALGDPDAFLPTDLGILRGARAAGLPDTPKALAAHAERWRPWRSYAAIRLWRMP